MPSEYAASLTRRFQDASPRVRRSRASTASRRCRSGPTRLARHRARTVRGVRAAGGRCGGTMAWIAARCRRAARTCIGQSGGCRAPRARCDGSRAERERISAGTSQTRAGESSPPAAVLPASRGACRRRTADAESRGPRAPGDPHRPSRIGHPFRPSAIVRKSRRDSRTRESKLAPRIQELRDADEWQRWANLQVQEEICRDMEALKAEPNLEVAGRDGCESCRRDGNRWRWRRVRKARPCGGASKLRRMRSTRARRRFFAAQNEERAGEPPFANRRSAIARKRSHGSTDWVKTATEIQALQAEWKTIGPVARGHEKAIWERFRARLRSSSSPVVKKISSTARKNGPATSLAKKRSASRPKNWLTRPSGISRRRS